MKELKKETIYLKEYDVTVNAYLTPNQIEAIALEVIKLPSWIEREQTICYHVLKYATDINGETLDNLDPNTIVASGLWCEVEYEVRNLHEISEAVKFYESPVRLLADVAQKLPDLLEQLKGVDIKDIIGNADIQQ